MNPRGQPGLPVDTDSFGIIFHRLQNLLAITLQVILVILVLQIIGLQLTVVSAIIAGLTVAAGLALSGIGVSLLDVDRYTITINVWTKAHGFYDTPIALNEKIVNDLKAAGVKFPGM